MDYTQTEWKNRLVERPRTFRFQQNADGSVTLNPDEGQITEQGTPVNAENMNKIEQGIADSYAHMADDVAHITAAERTSWNGKETTDGARKKVEQTDFKITKSNKDANGIFTTIQYKRSDDTLAIKSVLSGGTSPQYTTRTITYYGLDGATAEKTTTHTLSYDIDGVLISEV